MYSPCVGGEALVRPLAVIGLTSLKVDSLQKQSIDKTISYKSLVNADKQRSVVVVLASAHADAVSIARSKRQYSRNASSLDNKKQSQSI